jgi:hypothetical protein
MSVGQPPSVPLKPPRVFEELFVLSGGWFFGSLVMAVNFIVFINCFLIKVFSSDLHRTIELFRENLRILDNILHFVLQRGKHFCGCGPDGFVIN